MSDQITQVKQHFLSASGLEEFHLEKIFTGMLGHQIDAADLYFQSIRHEGWSLEDGIVKSGSFNADRGVGVRAISGEKTGFAYANDINMAALEAAATASKSIARTGDSQSLQVWQRTKPLELYKGNNPLDTLSSNEKVALLKRIDTYVRQKDDRIKQVSVSLAGVHEHILIAASDGTLAGDLRPLVRLNISVIVEENGRIESGGHGGGGRESYQIFQTGDRWQYFADEAVRQALVNLEAQPAPAGLMPVVMGPGWNGVVLHEAVGHGLEGDFNRKGSSVFTGKIGEKVASELCTIVDDGTLEGRRGSLSIDDEGEVAQNTILIEKGILKNYMQDKMNARLMGTHSTGNGRRESYAHQPMPRMTNTYMLAGNHQPGEIIASVDEGLYVANMGGGQVDITSGKFVFSASEAYMIRKGKLAEPVKGATLIGNGPDIMHKVSMVGNDLKLDDGVGVCGKDGQSVPVGVGQPTFKIDELTVGGTGV